MKAIVNNRIHVNIHYTIPLQCLHWMAIFSTCDGLYKEENQTLMEAYRLQELDVNSDMGVPEAQLNFKPSCSNHLMKVLFIHGGESNPFMLSSMYKVEVSLGSNF